MPVGNTECLHGYKSPLGQPTAAYKNIRRAKQDTERRGGAEKMQVERRANKKGEDKREWADDQSSGNWVSSTCTWTCCKSDVH
eukprot:4566962-Pleurochrysis_carterae.AAC.5